MIKSELQHQFWVTKKVVQRKLGIKKEDECVISSDALLDSKIELFKSISDSSKLLYHILDQYQERLCILAQEENALGKFLKEAGKTSNTTSKIMINTGKAISYSGQIRMTMRPPLLRLHHEVEVFRERAVEDTQVTISIMEKERTEYRAALGWIKSISGQLDPDSGRSIEKFRKAQNMVRNSKLKFDRLSLDCLQKIDLLAASRSSMFSHALVSYMTALLHFYTKSTDTFQAAINTLLSKPQYNFNILKDLSQQPDINSGELKIDDDETDESVKEIDSDQMLFFLDEYSDDKIKLKLIENNKVHLNNINQSNDDTSTSQLTADTLNINENDLVDINDLTSSILEADVNSLKTSTFDLLLENLHMDIFADNISIMENFNDTSSSSSSSTFQLNPLLPQKTCIHSNIENISNNFDFKKIINKSKEKKPDLSSWYKLFSELDPFEDMEKKISGGNNNCQSA